MGHGQGGQARRPAVVRPPAANSPRGGRGAPPGQRRRASAAAAAIILSYHDINWLARRYPGSRPATPAPSVRRAAEEGADADLCAGGAGGVRQRDVLGAAAEGRPRGAAAAEPEPGADREPGTPAGVVRRDPGRLRRLPAA